MKHSWMAMTRADKLVTKVLLCVIAVSSAGVCLTSCSKESEDEMVNGQSSMVNDTQVSITFSPYDMAPMTRAATSISNYCTRLDVWIIDDDNDVTDLHQSSSDDGFGSINVALNRTKTYTLVAVAHRASGAATLTDGVIAFPDEKVTHAMICQTTFSPATTTSLSCLMQRIVGQFVFQISDQVPDNAYTVRFGIANSFTRWDIAGEGVNAIDRTTTFNDFSRANDGTASFTVYVIPANLTATDEVDITVTALTEGGDAIEQRTFSDVPIKAGYKTTYRGGFFVTTGETATFTVEDWSSLDTITY